MSASKFQKLGPELLRLIRQGKGRKEAAAALGIDPSTAWRWLKKLEGNSSRRQASAPQAPSRHVATQKGRLPPAVLMAREQFHARVLRLYPDLTAADLVGTGKRSGVDARRLWFALWCDDDARVSELRQQYITAGLRSAKGAE